MKVIISTTRTINGSISKFRILCTKPRGLSEVAVTDIKSYLRANRVANAELLNENIFYTQGRIEDYPYETYGQMSVVNGDRYIFLAIDPKNEVYLCDYKGSIKKCPLATAPLENFIFANAIVSGKNIKLKDTSVPIDLSTGCSATNISNGSKQDDVSYINIVKGSKDTGSLSKLNLVAFNVRDYAGNMSIDSDVFRTNASLFSGRRALDLSSIAKDKSAYSFDIVSIDGRVELQKYNGDNYEGLVEVPDEVTHICSKAFYRARAKELILPDSVVYLGEKAFEHSRFRRVKLSKNITAIPAYCFLKSHIEELDLENIKSIGNGAFKDCTQLREARVKGGISQVGFSAFEGCSRLEVFEHTGTLKKIRHDAFRGCLNLVDIDLSTVVALEARGLYNTGLRSVKLRGEIRYLQAGTVTGEVEEIVLEDGFEKISADSVSNIHGHPITWTVPKSVTNIERGAFKQTDTVICYNNSIAKSSARISESDIILIDKDTVSKLPRRLEIAMALDRDIGEEIRNLAKRAIERQEIDTEYPIDESTILRRDLPQEIIDLIGYNFPSGKYATDEDISAEKPKFRCVLEYLSKVARIDTTPIDQFMVRFKSTFYVDYKMSDAEIEAEKHTHTRVRGLVYGATKAGEYERVLETLYDDGVSKVFRIRYIDNKYLSDYSTFIVCKTYDTLRYICMENMYTDLLCETYEARDLRDIFNTVSPGDTLGNNCIIHDELYNDVFYESDKTITVNEGGYKRTKNLIMNLYQGLKYSAIAVKLSNNNILIVDPSTRKVMLCSALGKSTWLNAKEKTYETEQCTVQAIESLDSLTVINWQSSRSNVQYGELFKKLANVVRADKQAGIRGSGSGSVIEQYISSYMYILPAVQSMYKIAGDVACRLNMRDIVDIDLDFVLALFGTPLVETRPLSWLENSRGKTIIKAANSEFSLSDGTIIRQYETAKRTALSSKLMIGGDRKVYVFEIESTFDEPEYVYMSVHSFTTLVDMCLKITNTGTDKTGKVFVKRDTMDVVTMDDVLEIAPLLKNRKESLQDYYRSKSTVILGVYKPSGLYYIGSKITSEKSEYFVPLIQVGELDVVLGLIEASNELAFSSNATLDFLIKLNSAASAYAIKVMRSETVRVDSINNMYLDVIKSARDLCIEGVSDVASYSNVIPEIIKRCMGFSKGDYYKEVKPISEMSDIELDEFKKELAKSDSGNILLDKIKQVLGMDDEESDNWLDHYDEEDFEDEPEDEEEDEDNDDIWTAEYMQGLDEDEDEDD